MWTPPLTLCPTMFLLVAFLSCHVYKLLNSPRALTRIQPNRYLCSLPQLLPFVSLPFSILHPLFTSHHHSLTLFALSSVFTIMNDFTITTFLHLQQKQNPISILNYQYLTSIKTLTPHITCLAVHRNLLYAASLNLINVFDLSSSHYTLIDTFNETSTSGYY